MALKKFNLSSLRFGHERAEMVLGALAYLAKEIFGDEEFEKNPLARMEEVAGAATMGIRVLCDDDPDAIKEYLKPLLEADKGGWDTLYAAGITTLGDIDVKKGEEAVVGFIESCVSDEAKAMKEKRDKYAN